MNDRKHIKTFKEFLKNKSEEINDDTKKVNWEERKYNWLKSIDELYILVDRIIVQNFNEAGYKVEVRKTEVRISEDYVGTYSTENYIINVGSLTVMFNPIGTIILGSYGRVNMVLPNETIILVLSNWIEWKIVSGFAQNRKLLDFNEENIVQIFEDNL